MGCGVGLLRGHIEHLGFEAFHGIDPSSVAVEAAVARGFARASFAVGTEPTGEHDVIICNEMLYYVEDLGALLARIADCLNPDGRLVVSVYKHPGDFALHRIIEQHFRPVHAVDVRNRHTPHRWRLASYAVRRAEVAPHRAPKHERPSPCGAGRSLLGGATLSGFRGLTVRRPCRLGVHHLSPQTSGARADTYLTRYREPRHGLYQDVAQPLTTTRRPRATTAPICERPPV